MSPCFLSVVHDSIAERFECVADATNVVVHDSAETHHARFQRGVQGRRFPLFEREVCASDRRLNRSQLSMSQAALVTDDGVASTHDYRCVDREECRDREILQLIHTRARESERFSHERSV